MTITIKSSQDELSSAKALRRKSKARVGGPEDQAMNLIRARRHLNNLINNNGSCQKPECFELGDLKSVPMSNETECIEIGQLKAAPDDDFLYHAGVADIMACLDQTRQEMPSLLDADEEREKKDPQWKWERDESAWYGCIVDVAGEAAELFNEGLIGDGDHIHAAEMRGVIEICKEKQLAKAAPQGGGARQRRLEEGQVSHNGAVGTKFPVLEIVVSEHETIKSDLPF
eukprot:scaffold918_cov126-Cylindrotheca_fusiformis.AAC.34